MKKLATLSFALLMTLILAAPAMAGDTVTLEGDMQCAKCTRHMEGMEKCQNVLVVMKDGEESLYYLAKNETSSEYGDVCRKTTTVRVTGTLEEKDGHTWIAASEIVAVEEKG